MQAVSAAWIEMQSRRLVNESYVNVTIGITDPDVQGDATASDNGHFYLSDTGNIIDVVRRTVPRYVTLERNLWRADGSVIIAPQSGFDYSGFVGNVLSGEDGAFSPAPTIDIDFSVLHEPIIPGITITWSQAFQEYATDFKISAYNGTDVVAETTVTGNANVMSSVWLDISNYNKIRIEVLRWSMPQHYARIERIYIGITTEYDKKKLVKFEHTMASDPINAAAPSDEISFSIDNIDDEYDPNNAEGMSKYLMERQQIMVDYGLKMDDGSIETIPAGVFYLSEWNAPQNGIEATFAARDIFGFLQDEFVEGKYAKSGATLYDLATQVLESAELPLNEDGSKKWALSDTLKSITTTAPIPICTRMEALQYIAQAGACVMYFDRAGVLHMEPALDTISKDYKLTYDNMYEYPEVTLQKPVRAISTKIYQYFPDADRSGVELYSGDINISGTRTLTLTYSEPAQTATATVSNGTLNSATYYAGACILTITSAGTATIKITGKPLKSTTADYVKQVEKDGDIQSVDNPLITSSGVAQVVTDYVAAWITNRRQVSLSNYRADPRLDVGNIIVVDNKYGAQNMRVSRVTYSFTGAFHGAVDGRII